MKCAPGRISLCRSSLWALSRVRPARRRRRRPIRRSRRHGNSDRTASVTTVNQAIDRIIAREHDENATIRRYNPIIETYIQDMKPDKQMGAIPVKDHYFLGQANLSKGVVDSLDARQEEGQDG